MGIINREEYKTKKCPFCGGVAYVEDVNTKDGFRFIVRCGRCKSQTGLFRTVTLSLDAWNIREGGAE